MNKIKKFLQLGTSLTLLALPIMVQARLNIPNPAPGVLPANANSPAALLFLVINILLSIAGLLAVLFIIIGGFQYITSGANSELAETAKKTIQNAIIGLVVIILSFIVVQVINQALG